MLRTPHDVAVDADKYTRELVGNFHEVVRLSQLEEGAFEPDVLQLRQLSEAMAHSAGALEAVVSQLKYAAVIRDGRKCEALVLGTADGYDALASAQAAELAAIVREVDESIEALEAELED